MTSITELARRASHGNESAISILWTKYKNRLIERAGNVLKRYGISSTEPEEVATTVFAECVMWTQTSQVVIENRKAYWALLSRATILHSLNVLKHDTIDKRPQIWSAQSLVESQAQCTGDEQQVILWDEYKHHLNCHPSASIVFPMLIDRLPIDVIAKKLNISVRSAYRLVAELTKGFTERVYE